MPWIRSRRGNRSPLWPSLRPICRWLLVTAFGALAFAQDVQVQLSLADGKTSYRSGEAIRVVLTFTALKGQYLVNTTSGKPMSPVDRIAVTPETGVYHWLDDYKVGHPYFSDGFGVTPLSSEPLALELVLNDCFRIDGPGTYTASVTTKRLFGGASLPEMVPLPPLTTNEVTFTVTPMTDQEERAEIARLNDALSTLSKAPRTTDRAASQKAQALQNRLQDDLMYLSGDPSTGEKLHQLMAGHGFLINLQYGLFMARNRPFMLESLETALA